MPSRPEARLRWWTRHPSPRAAAVLAVPVAVVAWAAWTGRLWPVTAAAVLLGAVETVPRWLHGETAWRRRYPVLPAGHALHDDVEIVARRFGLWRRPVVLLAGDLGSPAAAVDTAHPGATVLVTPEFAGLAAAGGRRSVQAILAHELAHLHRFHVPVLLAQHLATTAAAASLSMLSLAAFAAERFGAGPGGPAPAASLAVAAGVAWVAKPLLAVVQAHVSELDADRDAARLGYGHHLADLLAAGDNRRVFRRGLLSHPHPQRRVRALGRVR